MITNFELPDQSYEEQFCLGLFSTGRLPNKPKINVKISSLLEFNLKSLAYTIQALEFLPKTINKGFLFLSLGDLFLL